MERKLIYWACLTLTLTLALICPARHAPCDQLVLKNGGVLKGDIYAEDGGVVVRHSNGDCVSVPTENVETIVRNTPTDTPTPTVTNTQTPTATPTTEFAVLQAILKDQTAEISALNLALSRSNQENERLRDEIADLQAAKSKLELSLSNAESHIEVLELYTFKQDGATEPILFPETVLRAQDRFVGKKVEWRGTVFRPKKKGQQIEFTLYIPALPGSSLVDIRVPEKYYAELEHEDEVEVEGEILGQGNNFLKGISILATGKPKVTKKSLETARRGVSPLGVTLAGFRSLRTGMSLYEVQRILGSDGVEISSSELGNVKTVMYQWEGDSLGANMNAMFQDGELVSKAQFGLK